MSRHGESFWKEEKDRGNVGLKLLRRMGWKEGSGLGKHKTGAKTCLQMRRKSSVLGIGAEEQKSETWVAATNVFNGVLAKLQNIGKNPSAAAEQSGQEESAAMAIKKHSARNKLYTRFAKAKDCSSYSSTAMKEILGVRPKTQEEVLEMLSSAAVSGRGGLGCSSA